MKKSKYLYGLSFVFAALLSVSNGFALQGFRDDKPPGEIEKSMESNLTWNLQNALLLYYPENKFVINARVKLKQVEPKQVLPKLPDALLSRDLTNLPGLPYLPENFSKPQDSQQERFDLQRQVVQNNYEIEQIRVGVLVDRSLGQNDWEFIRRFVNLTANLEPTRGDQVRIEGLDFPEKANFFPPEEPLQPKPVYEPAPYRPATEQSKLNWLPYWFAGGLALLLLILFLVGQKNIVKHLKTKPAPEITEAQFVQPENQIPALPEPKKAEPVKGESSEFMQDLKSKVIDIIVGTPNASALVFSKWIEEQGDTGLSHVAIVLSTLSRSLVNLLEPHLGQKLIIDLHQRIALLKPEEVEQNSKHLLKQFDDEVRHLILKDKYDPEADALSFLNHMTDEQLQHLVKPLKTGVMAIVLAQLRTNRAAKILTKLDSDERKAVLAAMGNIDRIPSEVYQNIAKQLAVRANELKQMRYVSANGIDSLIKVLDYLDEDEQTETIDYIQTKDVILARKVTKQFMTFSQLITQSGDKLREVALEVDRDMLAKSLVTLDDQTVEKIISSLPEKLGELVRASLEMNVNIPDKEVAEARRGLMRSLRSKNAQLN